MNGYEIAETVAGRIAEAKAAMERLRYDDRPDFQSKECAIRAAEMWLEFIEETLGFNKRPILVRVVDEKILERLEPCPEHGFAPEVLMIKCVHHGLFTLVCRCPDWASHGFRGVPVREVYRSGWDEDGLVREWNDLVAGSKAPARDSEKQPQGERKP